MSASPDKPINVVELIEDAAYKRGVRDGIEAVAKMLEPITSWSGARGALATEVRALVDAPASDKSEGG